MAVRMVKERAVVEEKRVERAVRIRRRVRMVSVASRMRTRWRVWKGWR